MSIVSMLSDIFYKSDNFSPDRDDMMQIFKNFFGENKLSGCASFDISSIFFEPYLECKWIATTEMGVSRPDSSWEKTSSPSVQMQVYNIYRADGENFEIMLQDYFSTNSCGQYQPLKKSAYLLLFLDYVSETSNERKFIKFKFGKRRVFDNSAFQLKDLAVDCYNAKKAGDAYEVTAMLFNYTIEGAEDSNLYVKVELEKKTIGTISIDEFISSILNKELEKLLNCSFSSFQSTLTSKKANI